MTAIPAAAVQAALEAYQAEWGAPHNTATTRMQAALAAAFPVMLREVVRKPDATMIGAAYMAEPRTLDAQIWAALLALANKYDGKDNSPPRPSPAPMDKPQKKSA